MTVADTKIEWTDVVWNPTTGCDRVSPGCDHCYALTLAKRLKGMGSAKYQNDGDQRTSGPGFLATEHGDTLTEPLRWRKPRKVFVNSMSDLFHERVSDEFLAKVFAVMAATPQHTYQILTKRHARMRSLLSSDVFRRLAKDQYFEMQMAGLLKGKGLPVVINAFPPKNVWLGVSVESQQWADIRIPALLDTPAAVRWLSCEPLLGSVDLDRSAADYLGGRSHVDWVVVGGESGPGARPMHPDWARSLRDQCVAAGVPFHFKQWGEWLPLGPLYGEGDEVEDAHMDAVHLEVHERRQIAQVEPDGTVVDPRDYQPAAGTWLMAKVGKGKAGRELDGRTWDQYPEVSR